MGYLNESRNLESCRVPQYIDDIVVTIAQVGPQNLSADNSPDNPRFCSSHRLCESGSVMQSDVMTIAEVKSISVIALCF